MGFRTWSKDQTVASRGDGIWKTSGLFLWSHHSLQEKEKLHGNHITNSSAPASSSTASLCDGAVFGVSSFILCEEERAISVTYQKPCELRGETYSARGYGVLPLDLNFDHTNKKKKKREPLALFNGEKVREGDTPCAINRSTHLRLSHSGLTWTATMSDFVRRIVGS